jgi:hypothetical protein
VWRAAAVQPDDPMADILAERDLVRRVQKALAASSLPEGELTTIVTDALAALPQGGRHALAEWLLEKGSLARLSVVAAEEAATLYRELACLQEVHETVRPNSTRHKIWKRVEKRLAMLNAQAPASEHKANMLAALFSRHAIDSEDAVDSILEAYEASRASLYGQPVRPATGH